MGNFNEILFCVVSVIATFVSANTNLKPFYKSLIMVGCFGVVFFILLWKNQGEIDYSIIVCGLIFLILAIAIYFFTEKSDLHSRKKIDKKIINFTKLADPKREIKLFGGDLDFLGDIEDNTIFKNKQYQQLKNMDFRKIRILCFEPKNDKDKLRIGCLLDTFNNNIQIKFFEDSNCMNCTDEIKNKNHCSSLDFKVNDKNTFHKRSPYSNHPCNNPDLLIRGRIIENGSGAEYISITITYESKRKYIFKMYSNQNKEFDLYFLLWNVWWEKCKEYSNIQVECKKKYKDWLNN
jgi:hypothetical protein